MRHHPYSAFGRIYKAVSAAAIGLALSMVAAPFAAADPVDSQHRRHRHPTQQRRVPPSRPIRR
jgi:hypothetical protein